MHDLLVPLLVRSQVTVDRRDPTGFRWIGGTAVHERRRVHGELPVRRATERGGRKRPRLGWRHRVPNRPDLLADQVVELVAPIRRGGQAEPPLRADLPHGRRLHDIGAQVYEPRPGRLHELLTPIMTSLYEASRETVHLGVLLDGEVALLGRLHGRRTTPHSLHLGSRFPAHCSAMGKAMLAHDPVAADALIARGLTARTPRSITAPQRFRAELQHVRETGIATSDQEARPNLSCVAIPLRDQARRPVAALSISGPSRGFDGHRNSLMLRAVAAEAERLIRPAPVERRAAAFRARPTTEL
jgi:IclR family KDG regulon transcriptional repressor